MALNAFRIPLMNIPQKFAIDLNGRSFVMECKYNPEEVSWNISLFDGDTAETIFTNMPLVTGVDLLKQYAHLGIDGSFIVYTDGNQFTVPTETNLGAESNLYYLVEQAA